MFISKANTTNFQTVMRKICTLIVILLLPLKKLPCKRVFFRILYVNLPELEKTFEKNYIYNKVLLISYNFVLKLS